MPSWLIALGTLATLFIFATILSGCGPRYRITEKRIPLAVGNATVEVVVHEAEAPGLTYINLHDNEDTSAQAALAVIGEVGGRLIELQHSGQRNVEFVLGDSTYLFDPNRIFTDAGIAATLDDLGAYSDSAHAAVRSFAEALLDIYAVDGLDVVVTVHNNGETEYSALSYTEGREYAEDALATAVMEGADPDDFFFVTEASLFRSLRDASFNVVLQDNALVTDDGSLSVYCGQRGIAYVNVEAQHGHLEPQRQMIEVLTQLLTTRTTA